jgi:threonylcarbamoyladenosine tRNA methylthiotransferase MtaB
LNIYLDTIGCRLNQSEIETYARQFRAAGHALVASPAEADLVVVNTCAVTGQAAADSRQKLRQAARLGTGNIIATGCWATLSPAEAAALPRVQRVISNAAKDQLVADVMGVAADAIDLEPVEREPLPGAHLRTRAFLKVQDGCDNRCTFCITTLARGESRSRPVQEVLADVRLALKGGAQEVVLSGVHLGSWGQDFIQPGHLRRLIRAVLDETDTPRLRLSSLEPWDLDEAFFGLWENPRLCRHLHLPLQSGCAATLRRMARKTTPEAYTALVEAARRTIPGVAITTDVIAGFPGESDAEFAESLAFVRQMQFAAGHVFSYSARPGTAAAGMKPQVPHPLRKARNAALRAALDESAQAYQRLFVGQVLPVLWESAAALGPQGWEMSGLTDNYLRVRACAPQSLWNKITMVKIRTDAGEELYGEIEANL